MAGYVISNDTISFLQFDDKDELLKDTIASNTTKWTYYGYITKENRDRISRPNSLAIISGGSINVHAKTSYINFEKFINDNFTVDFWLYGIDMNFALSFGRKNGVELFPVGREDLLYRDGRLTADIWGKRIYFDYGKKNWVHCAFTFNISTGEVLFFYNGKKNDV